MIIALLIATAFAAGPQGMGASLGGAPAGAPAAPPPPPPTVSSPSMGGASLGGARAGAPPPASVPVMHTAPPMGGAHLGAPPVHMTAPTAPIAPTAPQGMGARFRAHPEYGQWHTTKKTHTEVFSDPRVRADVARDPHIVQFNHQGYKPRYHWNHWYRDWGPYWRMNDWGDIRTVTCEAVNLETQQLYPVTETRAGGWVWNSTIVNSVASRALDECALESGGRPDVCSLVDRECWNSIY